MVKVRDVEKKSRCLHHIDPAAPSLRSLQPFYRLREKGVTMHTTVKGQE